jgi:hypothetical protein
MFRRSWLLALGLGVAGVCVLVRARGVAAFGPTDFDDAYMFLRYAHNLRGGHGLAWNPGQAPIFGVTSLAHLLVVAGLGAVWPSLEGGRLLQVASTTMGLLAAGLLAFTCARFTRDPRLRGNLGLWAAIVVPLVTLTEAFEFHVRTGMDTTLSLLANAAVVHLALAFARRPTRRLVVQAALASFVAVLVRPDNLIVAGLCPLLLLWQARGTPSFGRTFAALFAALVLVGLALARWRLGTALPLAFHAKQPGAYAGFAGEYTWNPFLFLKVFLGAALPFVTVLLLLVDRARWRLATALLLPPALTIAGLFSLNQIMGHLGRFYFPFLPYFVVAAALVADGALATRTFRPWRVALAAAVLLAGGPALEWAGRRYQARAATQRLARLDGYATRAAQPLPELDSWQASVEVARLAAAAPPGTVFAMSEHGLVGARAPDAIIVDVLGLHDRTFALHGFTAAELWRRRPDAIWMPHPDHTGMLRELLDSDELWSRYDFYPEAFTYGVALRRDGPAQLRAQFEERWKAVYATHPIDGHKARRPPANP